MGVCGGGGLMGAMLKHSQVQEFKLPRPALFLGGEVRLVLLEKAQRQTLGGLLDGGLWGE